MSGYRYANSVPVRQAAGGSSPSRRGERSGSAGRSQPSDRVTAGTATDCPGRRLRCRWHEHGRRRSVGGPSNPLHHHRSSSGGGRAERGNQVGQRSRASSAGKSCLAGRDGYAVAARLRRVGRLCGMSWLYRHGLSRRTGWPGRADRLGRVGQLCRAGRRWMFRQAGMTCRPQQLYRMALLCRAGSLCTVVAMSHQMQRLIPAGRLCRRGRSGRAGLHPRWMSRGELRLPRMG
jgi:hypothetical protein